MPRPHRLATALLLAFLAASCAAAPPPRPTPTPIDPDTLALPDLPGPPPDDLASLRLAPETVLIENATIFTAEPGAQRLERASILLEGGRITAVSADPLTLPEGAARIDAAGRFITPGVIDTHSHLGVYPTPYVDAHSDGNEATSPTTPDVRAEDAVWPQDPGFQRALEGGVTALQILPGSANLIGGRAVTLKLHPGRSARAMRFPDAPWGLKMACGENPKRVYGERKTRPSTRMGNAAVWRGLFQRAAEHKRALQRHEAALQRWQQQDNPPPDKKPDPPPRDLALETLIAAFDGDILLHIHCYRADDMLTVLQLAREFGFHVRSFHHAVEAYKIRDVLAAEGVAVSTWADWWGFKMEAIDAIVENAALLHQAGARPIIHSDDPIGIQRLNQEAAKVYHQARARDIDLTEEEVVRWFTANPAWALGVEDTTGTLTPGKAADLVVWSHHPLSVYARPLLVFVDGVRELDLNAPAPPWSDFEVGQLPGLTDQPGHAVPRARHIAPPHPAEATP